VALLATAATVGLASGCSTPTSSNPSDQEYRQICAADVSIARVDITVVSAPADATIELRRLDSFVGSDESGYGLRPVLTPPLEPGQSYTMAEEARGLVDLGLCLELYVSPGVVYQVRTTPVTDIGTMIWYAANGGHLYTNVIRGVPPGTSSSVAPRSG
jgi:hypothetical protein